ncbi:hypothetical protein KP509_23G080700 [Ceratopteris richardii]|uniref:Translation elongation factor EF1B beta/delta subunit guanine nucleotide exchange domain-containing protein n=1 Tax=Ceratopteris richardii TaxID=49495 RepID=A0A8T2S1M7_CERRI|nr:hypothetical protein KP509_23G080700 [Ceratopteris richardii]
MAVVELPDLSSPSGLKELDEFLSSRTYVSGDEPSKDDAVVLSALGDSCINELGNVTRWQSNIVALLQKHFPGSSCGVKFPGSPAVQTRELTVDAPPAPETPPATEEKAEEDDDDLDLFGEETEEEKKAVAEREAQKASAKKKESGKSSVLLDVKPWDDETDMVKLEEAVRSVSMPGLLWGASKLQPVGYGIKKLQIMMTIVDDLVSVDNLIEEYLTEEPRNEYIQSCDIVAFNKI